MPYSRTQNLENKLINWAINKNESTEFDHEIIRFDLITSIYNIVSNSLFIKYNLSKANWEKFNKSVEKQFENIETKMFQLIQFLLKVLDNLEKTVKLLENFIVENMKKHISKVKICNKFKRGGNSNLIKLKKIMSCKHQLAKNENSIANINDYKSTRTKYFHAIRKAKQDMGLNYLENADNKEIFDAYKYIKNKNFDKILSISYQDKTHVNFEKKCDAFIHVHYFNQISNTNEFIFDTHENQLPWEKLAETELKTVVNSFNDKKTCGPNEINFTVIQKIYKIISKTFELLYSKLMKISYYSKAGKICIEIILKKPNRPDYILFKTYRIIFLKNCLEKIIEKLMTNQLSYLGQITDLLDQNQIGSRKNYFTLNEIIELIHEIQTANQNKKIMFCLFLNIKRAFDYVNKK